MTVDKKCTVLETTLSQPLVIIRSVLVLRHQRAELVKTEENLVEREVTQWSIHTMTCTNGPQILVGKISVNVNSKCHPDFFQAKLASLAGVLSVESFSQPDQFVSYLNVSEPDWLSVFLQ